MTCEDSPRLLRREGRDALPMLHAYGTTGIMVEVEMTLAPRRDYAQFVLASSDWDALLEWTDAAARNEFWPKRLVTQFQSPVPSYFKPLARHFREGEHVSLLVIDRAAADEAVASATAAGIRIAHLEPFVDPPRPPYVSDYSFNHTTLWAIKSDPAYTYLQAGYSVDFREQFRLLRARFPGEIFHHLEWGARQAKPGLVPGTFTGDQVTVDGLPLLRFVSEDRLQEIIEYCIEIGVYIANPHTYVLEDGDFHVNLADKQALKAESDPSGILNPGKMRSYPRNPFAMVPAQLDS
jgi:FAD/FMN-containing dehydrogenase